MMTKQETFDTVVRGLLKQGRQSIDPETDECRYRCVTEDGVTLKCAAGMLIPDEKYDPGIEGVGISLFLPYDLKRHKLNKILTSNGHDLQLAKELQQVHDAFDRYGDESWHEYLVNGMTAVAESNGLSDAVLRERG